MRIKEIEVKLTPASIRNDYTDLHVRVEIEGQEPAYYVHQVPDDDLVPLADELFIHAWAKIKRYLLNRGRRSSDDSTR